MIIERSGFLLMAGVLAVGGGAGWALRDSGVGARPALLPLAPVVSAAAAPSAVKAEPSAVVVLDQKAAAPACDDSIGAPEECPALGPSDEGVCSNMLVKRCADFKASFKPRVAQEAVACLNRLKGGERCDPARVNLCGHSALMAACPEPKPQVSGSYVNATITTPASFILEDPKTPPSSLAVACESMSKSCAAQSPSLSFTDCVQTLAGMNEHGRQRTQECVTAHCQDRGLIGCEAMPSDFVQGQARR